MADLGSAVLPGYLEQAFRDVLQRDCDRDLIREAKEEKRRKKNKKDSKKDKDKKEPEEKRVIREGNNSLITFPNASCFSVSSHIRQFVKQQKLCDIYNLRYMEPSDDETSEEEEEEEKVKDHHKLPEVVGLGIRGVFTILRDVWQSMPELCLKVLREFLNILQGQEPAGLKHEPQDTTTSLFKLLIEMVSHSTEPLAVQISSLASACLISLVIALGDTEKILEACATLLSAEPDLSSSPVKVSKIFHSLQASVQAVLLNGVFEAEWSKQGVHSCSLMEKWPLTVGDGEGLASSIASDGSFLYIHGKFGLLKLGTGYGNTTKSHVYGHVKDFHTSEDGWLGLVEGKLLFYPRGVGADVLTIINREDLHVETTMALDAEVVGRQFLFSDGTDLRQIMLKKDGKCVLRKLTLLCSPIIVAEEKLLQLSQKSVLSMKRGSVESFSTVYQDSVEEIVKIIAAKNVTAILTKSGKLLYTGSGTVFSIAGKDVPKGEWKQVELPDQKNRVKFVTCDKTGSFSVIVDDKGASYFAGNNKKGENGEPVGGQLPKMKKINKLKDHQVLSWAASTNCSAAVTTEGKLFMFGKVDEDIIDKTTGIVTGLLGVPVTQVAMGRSHTCILTEHGTVYTMGSNHYGQCGRNYLLPSDGIEVGMDEESDESDDDEEIPCAPGDHQWKDSVCKICRFCRFCTGYGPNCCNEGLAGRDPGEACGCGSGDSGCTVCGCCKVCGGEEDGWEGLDLDEFQQSIDEETYLKILRVRDSSRAKKEKQARKAKKDAKKEKKVQFEGGKIDDGEDGEDEGKKAEGAEGAKSTKTPDIVPLPNDATVMQIACGTFHTALLLHSGEVYMFGNGNHGQLGQGNNKPCGHPVKVSLPGPASYVACGDNHTVVLLETGDVYTFGKHQEGQLGRLPTEDASWHMSPGVVPLSTDSCKLKWVSASGNQTFLGVEESLVPENMLSHCRVFANSECVGIVSPPPADGCRSKLVMLDLATDTARRMDGEDQVDLTNMPMCVDPEYDLLWGCGQSQISCYNPLAVGLKDSASDTILSPSLCLPRSPEAAVMRSHAGLNLLFCLHTLATSSSSVSSEAFIAKSMKTVPVEDYHCLTRFNSQGGGWGYSHGSVEAFRFSPDQDIMLGGFGIFGGRGHYSADIKVFELGESADPEGEGNLVASGQERSYRCDRTKTYKLLFEKPVLLKADMWYIAYAAIASPSGASTDAGSSGQNTVTGPDKVTFKFRNSKRSNNGTDVGSGQIPELLYKLPEYEQEKTVSVQLLNKSFYSTVTPKGLQSLEKLLDWSWSQYLEHSDDEQGQKLSLMVKACLGLLSSHIREVFPEKGKSHCGEPDSLELAECIYHLLLLVQRIFSRVSFSSGAHLPAISAACQDTFISCFHAFYPSPLLSWFALCHLLQRLDPSDVVAGFPLESILTAVLGALSSPSLSFIGVSYDSSISLQAALINVEDSDRFPVLTSFMHEKVLEEHGHEELLSFTAVASKILALVSVPLRRALAGEQLPSSPVVEKAASFLLSRISELSLCSTYPDVARKNGLPVSQQSEKKNKQRMSFARFTKIDAGLPSLDTTELVFSVNKPVLLTGYSILGGTCNTYQYNVSLMQGDVVLTTKEGSYSVDELRDGVLDVVFPESVELTPDVMYKAIVEQSGDSYCVGSDGSMSVTGPESVAFSLHSTGTAVSNPETGTLNRFLYSSIASSSSHSVVNLSVHMASMLLDIGVGFLERLLSEASCTSSLEKLGSSFLFSSLLPATIAQLGPISAKDPRAAVDVMTLVQRVLPVISAATNYLRQSAGESHGYSDAKLMHYANVDTEHPYKQACVTYYRVIFPERVHWMTMEFDPRSGFAQNEDKIANFLIPRNKSQTLSPLPSNKETSESAMIEVTFEDIYNGLQLSCPAGLVLVPGNEVHIAVNTDTEYEKRDKNNHFGVKCKVIGYEYSDDIKESLFQLEKELVSLGAMCAGSLLQEGISDPSSDELPVSSDPTDTEKADMRIVQAAGHEVLSKHNHLLCRGLLAKPPSLSYVFEGEIPVINNSHEQQFLQEFIGTISATPGGRLARWLQPDRSVDMSASDLEFISIDTPLRVSSQLKYIVRTRDQDKKLVYVEGMNVEVKVVWEGASEDSKMVKERVDSATGVRRPAFKRSYNPTMLGTNHVYHSVSMMMPYSDYSFEELRFFAPKVLGHSENMAIQNNKDGTYTATWVPSTAGSYSMHICIEGSSPEGIGRKVIIEPLDDTGSQLKPADDDKEEEEEEVVIEKIKRKTFPGTLAQGVRVRTSPSLNGASIGIIRPGENLSYTEEISSSPGTWIKLTVDMLDKLKCSSTTEGYALAYHKAKDQCYLEEIEPIESRHVVTKTQQKSQKERQGGPGVYTVVQCGSAGHNLRSRPNMRGTPVGRLTKGSTVNIVEEEENDDGIWLKLATDSARRYCDVESEAWTLAVHPSSRIFLALEGDSSFKATLPQSFGASLPTAFPTAASVFGTSQQSLFGTPLSAGTATSPAPPKFKFTGIKLAFGEGSSPSGLFRFSSPLKLPELKVGDQDKEDDEDDKPEPSLANESPVFNIGVLFGEKLKPRAASPRRRRSGPRSGSPRRKLSSGDSGGEQVSEELPSAATSLTPTEPQPRHALSPAIAECQRAVFAAFLWQEGLVNDAIVSASYLKFNTEEREKREDGDKANSKSSLPPTLSHLVTLWDEISMKVIENSSKPFSPPEVPALAQELLKRYEEEKKQVEKLKKDEKKSGGSGGGSGGGGGSTNCELCDEIYPDPVTYHMKECHVGCGRHASGWGYNSRGSYCSGWAGNCGDGGRGGSTWYLLCKDCHSKFMSMKAEKRKKITKTVFTPRVKTRKPGKPRSLPVVSAVQGMIKNSKFLLEVAWAAGDCSKRSSTPQHDPLRQSSIPEGEEVIEKRLSLPRPSADTPFHNPLRQPYLLRSASVATGPPAPLSRTYSDSGEEAVDFTPQLGRQTTLGTTEEASKVSLGSSLMTKPSMALANLMYLRSKQGSEDKETGYGRVMHFVTHYHDLEGLRATMKQAMRVAVLRACALEFLRWLLEQIGEPAVIHDVLWHFMSALSSHPMVQAAIAKLKAKKEEDDEEQEEKKDLSLGRHPLAGLDGAGSALTMLRKEFHSLLQTIANTMGKLPVGSSAQQMALKCWCLDFQQADHSFLLQSKVFAGISEALSNMEDRETDRSPPSLSIEELEDQVQLMEDILTPEKLKVSSNEAMMSSLNDGSTETFWESKDDARDKPRSITATFNKPVPFFGAAVHVDNLKDAGQRVDTIKLLIGTEEDSLKEVAKVKLLTAHTGWKTLLGPADIKPSIIRLEFKGVQKHVRVRQIQILAYPSKSVEAVTSSVLAQQKDCEMEALRLFRLLTSKVFGGLLSQPDEEREGKEETDAGPSSADEEEASSTMVNLLFTKNHLSSLQKQVCLHIIDSVHTETTRIKEEWIVSAGAVPLAPPPPPLPPRNIPRKRSKEPLGALKQSSISQDEDSGSSLKAKGTDTYCYELLTMLGGLSQSEPGCKFLVEQSGLLKDLISLLHTASSRLQLQVCSLMRRILPFIKPSDFAARTGVTVLPPLGYSAIAEAVNSAATINHLGLLDCFLAVISKALSVQVKAKGRGSNVLQALTKDSGTSGVTLAGLTSPKPVPGEGSVNHMRWYLHGSMDQEVAAEVVKLLKAMIDGGLKGQWREYAKSAVGQAVLHLTKITEDSRHVDPGIYSQTLWLCLAALCVINEEHAEALSSGQWLGQDGKPHTKPLCDNHDDGETKALILCDRCGNLCGECDRVLHYHQRTSDHQRQVFKEEEEAVKVDLHEGCGRIKLYWTMALADSRTLKGMVEFRDAVGGGGKGSCRFCGTANSSGMLAIGNVCGDPECQERAKNVCQKTLPCGHLCCGVRDEAKCLPCLQGCKPREGDENTPPLKQDADDMCMICYTEGLSCAPCIQLECGHLFHYECCHRALTKRWSGPRITFRFMFCSICENKPISHPHLEDVTTPLRQLYEDTQRKCQMRLEYENQSKCDAITSPSSKFYNKPLEYAMWKYAYYVCYKCKKAYYGGEAHCAEQAAVGDDYDPTELVCPACSHTGGGQAQICPKHGTDFLEYKCRYCCSVAVYYCFGTTHFCTACHDDFQRLTGMSKSDFPQCPVGPRARPLSGTECPLHVKHPPTGEEFALGCGVCRNAQTF